MRLFAMSAIASLALTTNEAMALKENVTVPPNLQLNEVPLPKCQEDLQLWRGWPWPFVPTSQPRPCIEKKAVGTHPAAADRGHDKTGVDHGGDDMTIDRGVLTLVILVVGAIVVWVAGGIISIYWPDNATPQQVGDFRLLPTQDDLRRYRSVLALAAFVCLAIVVLTTEKVQDEIRKVLASDDYGIPKFDVENYCENVPLVF